VDNPRYLLGAKVAYKHDPMMSGVVIAIHTSSVERAKFPGEWEYLVLLDQPYKPSPAEATQAWFAESKLNGESSTQMETNGAGGGGSAGPWTHITCGTGGASSRIKPGFGN
jgi:hypothetical protein